MFNSSRPNWYWTHAVCNQRVLFFSPQNYYYFSDLETQWTRNLELKFACLQQLPEGVSQNIKEKSLSSVSELEYPLAPPQKKIL